MPAFAVNGQRRLGPALAIGLGGLAALSTAASIVFGQAGADWLRFSLVAQAIVVAALAAVLARQIAASRRMRGSLLTANTDLAGAQASLETTNRALRAVQAELKRARRQLIDGIEGLSDGFALYDAEDRLVVCNSRYRALFGLHPDLLRPGTPFVDILRAHVNAGRAAAAVSREDAWIAERLAQHRDPGGLFERNIDGHWFRFSDRPTSEGGTITIFSEIDELKQREQRLRENQAILQSILDHIPVTVGIADRERRIVLLNRRLEALYGVRLADVIGRNVADVRPARYASDGAAGDHVRVLETGEPILGRQVDYGDGRDAESWIVNVVPIKGEDGSVRHVLRTTFEVPQLAKANRELADYRAFLIEAERQAKIASWQQTAEGGGRTIWSENLEAVIGYPGARLQDDAAFLAVVHPADRERIERLLRDVDGNPRCYDAEYRVVRADGRTIWVRGIAKVEFDAGGGAARSIGSIQDITETKRAEEALRASEALLKAAQRRARLAYWLWDPEAKHYSVAAEGEEILGLPVADLRTDADFLPYVHEGDRPRVAEAYRAQTERLEPGAIEYRWHRPDGRVIWLRDVCEQECDAAGRVRRLVGTIQDVSEQKRSGESLRESEARLRRAQQQARLAYWSWQFAGDTAPEEYRWSPGSGQLLGMADADMPRNDGESMRITIPEDRERLRRLYDEVRAGLDDYVVEYRARRRDGVVVWVREIAEVVRDVDGRRVGVEGTMQDITDQRALEEQLRQAQKMESIGQLTGGIAHDFNNLMAVILGNLELLAEDLPGNAAAQRKIATAIRSTLRGSDLTQRLLAFARRQSLAPQPTQIDELIRSMRDLLLRPLGPAIAATFALGGGLRPTVIDQARLETSLLNLVINARDAMPDGGKLTIAASNLAIEPGDAREVEGLAAGDYVLIAVGDSGAGMTDDVQARAFDPFFTTKGIGKGTGLGLSMVYGFVKQSGGHIELISEVGHGTTVKIYLPAAKGPAAAGAPALPQG